MSNLENILTDNDRTIYQNTSEQERARCVAVWSNSANEIELALRAYRSARVEADALYVKLGIITPEEARTHHVREESETC